MEHHIARTVILVTADTGVLTDKASASEGMPAPRLAKRERWTRRLDTLPIAVGFLMGAIAIAVLLRMMRLLRQSRDEVRRLRRLIEYHFSHPKPHIDADADRPLEGEAPPPRR
jgi:hypothetical protein